MSQALPCILGVHFHRSRWNASLTGNTPPTDKRNQGHRKLKLLVPKLCSSDGLSDPKSFTHFICEIF